MKIKTEDLTGSALDWAVLEALKPTLKDPSQAYIGTFGPLFGKGYRYPAWRSRKYSPSTSWQEGGPIIEREKIAVLPDEYSFGWVAHKCHFDGQEEELFKGLTPLIAAMRCYVASKLGDIIDIPEELK